MLAMSVVAVLSKEPPFGSATFVAIAIEKPSSRNMPLKAEYAPVLPSCKTNGRPACVVRNQPMPYCDGADWPKTGTSGGVTLSVKSGAGMTALLARARFHAARSSTLDHSAPAEKVNEASQRSPGLHEG